MAEAGMQRYRFDVDDFARMGSAGIFGENERVELIDGEVLEMNPIGPSHAWIVDRLNELVTTRLAGRAHVRVQNPIRLGARTEPQPDLSVAGKRQGYADRHPEAGDLLLVIEVADSSLHYDRGEKVPRYARAGIPETWVVDVEARTVTVYTDPGPEGYARERLLRRGERVEAAAIAELGFPVDEIFG